MAIKHVISVNVAVLGEVSGASIRLYKVTGARSDYSWSKSVAEFKRVSGFGSVGARVLAEDIAERLAVDFTTAKEILQQVNKELPQ